jgi:hypothetical protein
VHQNLEMTEKQYFAPVSEEEAKATKDVKKTIESSLWLSNEFPLKI